MSIIGEITSIPKHQLSDDLDIADHFHANGFEFKVLYITEDKIIAEEISDNNAFHELSERVRKLEENKGQICWEDQEGLFLDIEEALVDMIDKGHEIEKEHPSGFAFSLAHRLSNT